MTIRNKSKIRPETTYREKIGKHWGRHGPGTVGGMAPERWEALFSTPEKGVPRGECRPQ